MKLGRLGNLAAVLALTAGCAMQKDSHGERTSGMEQLLISSAVDRALDKVDLKPLRQKSVYVETKYLDGPAKNYVIVSLHLRLLNQNSTLTDKPESADAVLEVAIGAVGMDKAEIEAPVAAKPAAEAKAETKTASAAKTEKPKTETAKAETKTETAKTETAKTELTGFARLKAELEALGKPKSQTAKNETAKSETTKSETAKAETAKAETAKAAPETKTELTGFAKLKADLDAANKPKEASGFEKLKAELEAAEAAKPKAEVSATATAAAKPKNQMNATAKLLVVAYETKTKAALIQSTTVMARADHKVLAVFDMQENDQHGETNGRLARRAFDTVVPASHQDKKAKESAKHEEAKPGLPDRLPDLNPEPKTGLSELFDPPADPPAPAKAGRPLSGY